MLLVVSGNDPVRLVEEMARRIGRHRSPFLMERILMASPLLGAFVQRQLTLDLGIFSAISILPPGRFLWDVLVETFPEAPRQNPLSQDRVALFLMEFFSGNGTDREQCLPEGIPLPGDPESRWNLSLTLSEIIDRMVIYRPDWIARWERESVSTDSWSRLWNLIRRGVPGHRVSLLEQFSICCENSPERLSGMSFVKTPVHVYGQSLLPPSFLDFLKSLSRITDVVIYQWQPTDQYFSLPSKGSGQPDPFQGSATHPLTRALGKQSGRIRDLLLARADETSESFVPPTGIVFFRASAEGLSPIIWIGPALHCFLRILLSVFIFPGPQWVKSRLFTKNFFPVSHEIEASVPGMFW